MSDVRADRHAQDALAESDAHPVTLWRILRLAVPQLPTLAVATLALCSRGVAHESREVRAMAERHSVEERARIGTICAEACEMYVDLSALIIDLYRNVWDSESTCMGLYGALISAHKCM